MTNNLSSWVTGNNSTVQPRKVNLHYNTTRTTVVTINNSWPTDFVCETIDLRQLVAEAAAYPYLPTKQYLKTT
jgi:hypothetical protein